jgi:hypothetical protein
MPFYDDFDLSTIDVLLISQYVSTHLHLLSAVASWWRVPGISLQSHFRRTGIMYIRNNGILFASSSSAPVMCLLSSRSHHPRSFARLTTRQFPR